MTKSAHQDRVEEFMRLAGQDVPSKPTIPDAETRLLRAKLIFEEAIETIEALGFAVIHQGGETTFDDVYGPNMVEVADGCADIKVVTTGTLSAFGLPDVELQKMIDEANLRKFGPGGHRRDDGKWIKPPDWKAPDIKGWIDSL